MPSGLSNDPEKRERQLANLEMFKKGNQLAKGKGSKQLSKRLKEALAENNGALADELVTAIINHAKKGNAPYMKMLWDRMEGPIKEATEHGGNINIRVVRDNHLAPDPSFGTDEDADGEEEV